jgi:methylated-DNA-[protein]-cysteine S-methyltransferase
MIRDTDRRGVTRIANCYTVFNSPIGRIGIAASEKGICQVAFNASEQTFRSRLQKSRGEEAERQPKRFQRVITELKRYLNGKPVRFHARLDFGHATDFQKRVWLATLKIPRGRTKTYSAIARAIGKPKAFRAVGQALGKNPIPIIVPCHRVIGKSGRLVGFGGGIQLKKRLLELEGVKLIKDNY